MNLAESCDWMTAVGVAVTLAFLASAADQAIIHSPVSNLTQLEIKIGKHTTQYYDCKYYTGWPFFLDLLFYDFSPDYNNVFPWLKSVSRK